MLFPIFIVKKVIYNKHNEKDTEKWALKIQILSQRSGTVDQLRQREFCVCAAPKLLDNVGACMTVNSIATIHSGAHCQP